METKSNILNRDKGALYLSLCGSLGGEKYISEEAKTAIEALTNWAYRDDVNFEVALSRLDQFKAVIKSTLSWFGYTN